MGKEANLGALREAAWRVVLELDWKVKEGSVCAAWLVMERGCQHGAAGVDLLLLFEEKGGHTMFVPR